MGESISTGYLYDWIAKKTKNNVAAVTERGILCEITTKKKKYGKKLKETNMAPSAFSFMYLKKQTLSKMQRL